MEAEYRDDYMEDEYVEYAGFWLRVVAYLIDGIIISIPMYIIMAIVGGASFMAAGGGNLENLENLENNPEAALGFATAFMGGMALLSVLSIVAGWLYFALMESSAKQATVGKMALSLKVTDMEGDRISFGQATGRFFGKIISGLIFYVGFMMAGFTEHKQALHDIMAKTLVVKK